MDNNIFNATECQYKVAKMQNYDKLDIKEYEDGIS